MQFHNMNFQARGSFNNQAGFSRPVFSNKPKNAAGVNARLGPVADQKSSVKQEIKSLLAPAAVDRQNKPILSPVNRMAQNKPTPISAPKKPAPISAPGKPAPISAPGKPAPISAPAKPAPISAPAKPAPISAPAKPAPVSASKQAPVSVSRQVPVTASGKPSASSAPVKASPVSRLGSKANPMTITENGTPQKENPVMNRLGDGNRRESNGPSNVAAGNQRSNSGFDKKPANKPREHSNNRNNQNSIRNDNNVSQAEDEKPANISARLGPKNLMQEEEKKSPRANNQSRRSRGGQQEDSKENRRDSSRPRRPYSYYNQDNFWARLAEIGGEQYDLEALDLTEPKFNNQARLFIGSLPRDCTEEEIKEMFSSYGELGDMYHNKDGAYAFINYDYKCNAEKAVKELMGTVLRGRRLLIRLAAITSGIQVKNLSPTVTNELLHKAFTCFGPIELCRVSVDERGKSIGSGHIIFSEKRSAVIAYKRCQDGAFFITSALRPVIVEPWQTRDNDEGFTEANCQRNELYRYERREGPRFAETNSYEAEYGKKWKQLYEIYREKKTALENDLKAEVEALEVKMQLVIHQAETEKLRQELAIREQEALQLQMGLGSYAENVRPTQLSTGDDLYGATNSNSTGKRPYDYYDDSSKTKRGGDSDQPAAKRLQYDNSYRGGQYDTREYDTTQRSYANVVSGVSGSSYDAAGSYQVDQNAGVTVGDKPSAAITGRLDKPSGDPYSNYHQRIQQKDVDHHRGQSKDVEHLRGQSKDMEHLRGQSKDMEHQRVQKDLELASKRRY